MFKWREDLSVIWASSTSSRLPCMALRRAVRSRGPKEAPPWDEDNAEDMDLVTREYGRDKHKHHISVPAPQPGGPGTSVADEVLQTDL